MAAGLPGEYGASRRYLLGPKGLGGAEMAKKIKRHPQKRFFSIRKSSRFLLLYSLILLLTFLFTAAPVFPAQIRLGWEPNSEPDLAGYRVCCRTASGTYGAAFEAGTATTYTVTGLTAGQTYYLAVTAYDTSNNESGFSSEVSGVATDPGSTTVATNPPGLQIIVDGATYTSPQTFTWPVGSAHTLAAPSPLSESNGTRYVFSSWSDGGAQTHSISAPSSSATYTAGFATQYSLTTAANPVSGGTVSPAGTNWYNSGESVSLSTTGSSGYAFSGWSGNLSGSTTPATVVMNEAKTVTANFSSLTFAYTITTSPSGLEVIVDGATYTAPRTFNWTVGSSHSLSAPNIQGGTNGIRYVFSSWSDGGAQTHSLTAPAGSSAYGAIFSTQYSLNATANPGNGGNLNPAGETWHNRGQLIFVVATANSGFSFKGWAGSLSGTINPESVIIDAPKNVSANFYSQSKTLHPSPGVFNKGSCRFDSNGNGSWEGCDIDTCINSYGSGKDYPVLGDWSGDGGIKLGVYRSNGQWVLDLNGNAIQEKCQTDLCVTFGGTGGDIPVVGDWTGNKIARIGVYRDGKWILDSDGSGTLDSCGIDLCIDSFGGNRGDVPVVGDWNGDGTDKIGIYRNGKWILDKNGNGLLEDCQVDLCIENFGGSSGDIPVVGDWNGDGKDKIGIYRAGQWLLDYNGDGAWDGCDSDFCIDALGGSRGDVPVVARHPKIF